MRKPAQGLSRSAPLKGSRHAARSKQDTRAHTHTRAHIHARAHTCSLLCLLVVETGEWWRLGGAGILVPRERDLQVEVNIDK